MYSMTYKCTIDPYGSVIDGSISWSLRPIRSFRIDPVGINRPQTDVSGCLPSKTAQRGGEGVTSLPPPADSVFQLSMCMCVCCTLFN